MQNLDSKNNINNERDELTKTKNNKTSLITFAKLNKYFLIPFLCPVFCMLTNFFLNLIMENKETKKIDFFMIIFIEFSYISAGLIHFISYFKNNFNKANKNKDLTQVSSTGIEYIYNDVNPDNFKSNKIKILILLLSLILCFIDLLEIFIIDKNVFEKRFYFLFFIPIFSKIILKENIYKHQYFSLIIAISGIIFLFIPVCLKLESDDIVPNILNFISGILNTLLIVIIKYLTEKYYISPLKISLNFGIIAIFFNCIGFIIYSLVKYHDFSYFNDCFNYSQKLNKILISIYYILTFIFATILQLLTLLAIYYFSPTLIMVTDIISPFLFWITLTIRSGKVTTEVYFNPIGYVIVLFSSFIYNEIIIFNFCDLNKNTKKFVNKRLNLELEELQREDSLLENEKDTDNDS